MIGKNIEKSSKDSSKVVYTQEGNKEKSKQRGKGIYINPFKEATQTPAILLSPETLYYSHLNIRPLKKIHSLTKPQLPSSKHQAPSPQTPPSHPAATPHRSGCPAGCSTLSSLYRGYP